MEEILLQHGQEKLQAFLAEVNTILIVIILITTLIFIPRKKGKKPKLDVRIIASLSGLFWCIAAAFIYPEIYMCRERIGWFLVDIVIAVAIIHFRCVILNRRNGRCS